VAVLPEPSGTAAGVDALSSRTPRDRGKVMMIAVRGECRVKMALSASGGIDEPVAEIVPDSPPIDFCGFPEHSRKFVERLFLEPMGAPDGANHSGNG
jgi:hypothetical protein